MSTYIFPPLSGNSVFQFIITLQYPKPLIWRRVLVPVNYTFRDLHFVIQKVMGWSSTHMYKFNVKDRMTGEYIELGGCGNLGLSHWKSENAKLLTYFKNGKDKATYDYDFGFEWSHHILLEKILPADPAKKYPKCIAGERATPPEHDSPEERERYDPECFDAKLITFEKCHDYFKVTKKVQSFKEFSSGEYASDSSNFSNYGDDSSIRKKSGNTSSEVATTSTTKLAEQAIDKRQKLIDLYFSQNSNEADSSKLPQKRKAPEDNELKSVPAKLIVLENKDLQINSNTTFETTRIIENSEAEPSNSKGHAKDINVSSVTEDAEDYYGRFIASQMRNIKDLERREDLRIEIQQLVSKYRFKN